MVQPLMPREACVIFVHILRSVLNRNSLKDAITKELPAPTTAEIYERFAFLYNVDTLSREEFTISIQLFGISKQLN